MKINKYIFLTLLTLCTALSCQVNAKEERNPKCDKSLSKAEKYALKLMSPKKQEKLCKKIKEQMTPENESKLVDQIVDSSLSDTQKAGLVETLDSIKNQFEKE